MDFLGICRGTRVYRVWSDEYILFYWFIFLLCCLFGSYFFFLPCMYFLLSFKNLIVCEKKSPLVSELSALKAMNMIILKLKVNCEKRNMWIWFVNLKGKKVKLYPSELIFLTDNCEGRWSLRKWLVEHRSNFKWF